MSEERVSHFNAITELPELWNKNIEQIDLSLREVSFFNKDHALFVQGFIERQIKYHEWDGRLRKTSDRLQFAIAMGQTVESSYLLDAQLTGEYYIFQPEQYGKNRAILDQGFILTVRRLAATAVPIPIQPKLNTIQADTIVDQGQESIMVKLPLHSALPVVRPKEFKGTIRFIDFRDFPFVTAQVAGNITFQAQNQTAEQLLQQREICENLSLWIKAPALGPDQILFMDGTISDAQWDFETVKEAELEKQTECWVMELKVDYRWRLLITKELTCPESCTEPGSRVESIQSRLLQEHHIFTFSKILAIDFREFSQDIQLELEQVTYEHKLSKKGLLLSAKLTWGIIFINSDGVEEYRMYHTDFDELFPGYPEMAWDSNQNIITDHLTVRLQKFLRNRAQLELIIFGQYDAKIYQSKITPVLVDQKSAELIFAKTLVDKITFSFGAEKGLQLKYQFLRITGIKAKLLNLDAQPHRGWLRVSGILDVAISYFDRRRVLREDVFQIDVSNDYIWDKLISKMKIVISDSSNYDNYCIINGGLVYRYLITISAAAFEEKILRVATVNRQAKETEVFTTNDLAEEPVEAISPAELDLEKLGVEGEVLLAKGNAREIGTGRVWLSGFDYHYSQKAILIKGNLSGELEYWDEQRFLQKVLIDLPFWRFIQNTSGEPGRFRLNPEIKNCNYSPIKGSLWRKGSIKIDCELDLNPILAGDSG